MKIILHNNESFEKVYLNEPAVDVHIVQEAGSRVKIHVVDFSSAKNNIVVEQMGENCVTEIYALAFQQGEDSVTTETHVHHKVGGGRSKQLVKFVLTDNAQGSFYGEVIIDKDAQKTQTEQVNRNLLLSREAQMRTRPQLEIYADDVQASHGATTGQLDESALFYMRQRGISPEQARQMLVAAFLKDVLESLSDETLREQLMNTIDSVVK